MDIETKKQKLMETFNTKDKYPAKEFFHWHGVLTGSCEAGRLQFVKEHEIDIENGTMRVDEFFDIAKNAYGCGRIEEVRKKYNEKLLEKLLNR